MKTKLTIMGVLTLLLIFITSTVQASANLYVAPSGSDTGDCQSSACATIAYAIGQASANDVIILQDDITEGMVVVNKAITLNGDDHTLTSTSLEKAKGIPEISVVSIDKSCSENLVLILPSLFRSRLNNKL